MKNKIISIKHYFIFNTKGIPYYKKNIKLKQFLIKIIILIKSIIA